MTVYSLPTVNWLDMPRDGQRSLNGPAAPSVDLVTLLDAATGAGFENVGLDLTTVAGTRGIGALLHERHLRATEVGVLAISANAAVDVDAATTLASVAAEVGAQRCVTVLTTPPSAAALASLRRCGAILAQEGARLALEFMPYGPLTSLGAAVSVCSVVGWELCGLQLDAWHFLSSARPWQLLASLPADQIALLQLCDVRPPAGDDLRFEGRFRRSIPSTTSPDLCRFIDITRATGYVGPVSAEVLSLELRSLPPAEAARQLKAALSECWPA